MPDFWESHVFHRKSLLSEELFATYVATALFVSVLGAGLARNEAMDAVLRQTLITVFLVLACIILIWALLSFLNFLSFVVHRMGLILIVLTLFGALIWVLTLSFLKDL